MSNLHNILLSFHTKDELNSKIWNEEKEMNPKVRQKLLVIANEFIEYLGVDIVVSDIVMTGSLANYNWSEYSDVDLHIIADFNQFPEEQLPLYEDLFRLKKTIFNDNHDIKIFGYEVELYVQDEDETHTSSGVFSILNNQWVNEPEKESVEIDTDLVKSKTKQWMNMIDSLLENLEDEPIDVVNKHIKKLKDKIKKYRTCGLEKGGEYSNENLVFKALRRNGYIQKLFDFQTNHTDKKLSLKEATTNIGGTFKTDLENGPRNHGGRALGNWQSDNAWDIFSPPGTVVNSYTNGVVAKVRNTGKNSGKIYGTQVTIQGDGKFPDIFYTHLKNVNLKPGDKVSLGDYIGQISEWIGHEGMEHVHIGLPVGYHLRELLKNSDKIFSGEKVNIEDDKLKKKIDLAKKSTFLEGLKEIAKSDKEFKNLKEKGKKIPYNEDVEFIQTALQFLGYSLPKWGVDGLFGPETESATKKFKKEYGLGDDGIFDKKSLKFLYAVLLKKDFSDEDLSGIQKKSDFSKINVGSDKQFYEEVLKGIGAPITDGNLKFLYAWRQAEGAKATNNPFNTTQRMGKDAGSTNYNKVGVKNYTSPQIGVEATVKTLLNGYYPCIVDGLRNDKGPEEISRCYKDLKTWGTGELIAKVVNTGVIKPPPIYA